MLIEQLSKETPELLDKTINFGREVSVREYIKIKVTTLDEINVDIDSICNQIESVGDSIFNNINQ